MKHIVVFLPNGKTLMFEDVEWLVRDKDEISFGYFEKSNHQRKAAKFYTCHIVGWSASENLWK